MAATTAKPKTDETPKTETATVDPRIASDLARRMTSARTELGASRITLAKLTGLSPGGVWRVEQGRVHRGEVDQVTKALTDLETQGLPEEYRPVRAERRPRQATRAELSERLLAVTLLLADAREARSAKDKNVKLDEALALVTAGGGAAQVDGGTDGGTTPTGTDAGEGTKAIETA